MECERGKEPVEEPEKDPREGRGVVLRVDEELRFRVFRRQTRHALELALLGADGKPASDETIELNRHEVRIEGVVVHTFMALSVAEFNYLEP